MQALPTVINMLPAVASGVQAFGTLQSGKSNARALEDQGATALAQGFGDEAVQRRAARYELGKQAAAFAQAGGGYGGTVANVMHDSHVAAEIDALNYRYRGIQRGRGLLTEAKQIRKETPMLAGAQLLSGAAQSYANLNRK